MHDGNRNVRKFWIIGAVAAIIAWVALAPLFYVSAFAKIVPYDGSVKGLRAEWRLSPLTGFAHFYHAWGYVNTSEVSVRVVWHITTETFWGTCRYDRTALCVTDSKGFFDAWTYGYDYFLVGLSVEVFVADSLVWTGKIT
jgi:hypothetical protein